jgi:hypothetical protein
MTPLEDLKWRCASHRRNYDESGSLILLDLTWELSLEEAYDLFNTVDIIIPQKISYSEYKDFSDRSVKSTRKQAIFGSGGWDDDEEDCYQTVVNKTHAHTWLESKLNLKLLAACEKYREMLVFLGASERGCPDLSGHRIKLPPIPTEDPFDDFVKIVTTQTKVETFQSVTYKPINKG